MYIMLVSNQLFILSDGMQRGWCQLDGPIEKKTWGSQNYILIIVMETYLQNKICLIFNCIIETTMS
jgi:hypothetical protein